MGFHCTYFSLSVAALSDQQFKATHNISEIEYSIDVRRLLFASLINI